MTDYATFARLGVATVHEAAGRIGIVDLPLTQIVHGSRVAGPARIAVCGPRDNTMVHAVIAHASPGDVLVLYTDGIIEARNSKGELYGFDRLSALLATRPEVAKIVDAAEAFGQEDDITALSITRHSAGAPKAATVSLTAQIATA